MRRHASIAIYILVAAGIIVAGCVSTKPPIYAHTDFEKGEIGRIVVLPAVDNRANRALEFDHSDVIQDTIVKQLKHRGYEATSAYTFGRTGEVSSERLTNITSAPPWIEELGPADARWVLLPVVDVLEAKWTLARQAKASLHGYAFDKKKQELIWEGEGKGSMSIGFLSAGLVGLAMSGMIDEDAVRAAAKDMIDSVPEK